MGEPYDPAKKAQNWQDKKDKRKKKKKKKKKRQDQLKAWESLKQSKIKSENTKVKKKENNRLNHILKNKNKKGKLKKTYKGRIRNGQKPTRNMCNKQRSILIKKLDTIFAKYIRQRDSYRSTGKKNKCICITCGAIKPTNNGKKMNAGHFIKRGAYKVRFNEKNVHGQCVRCNNWGGGEQDTYRKAVDILYGDGTADYLSDQKRKVKKYTIMELEKMLAKYKKKYKELSAENIDHEKRKEKYKKIGKMIKLGKKD